MIYQNDIVRAVQQHDLLQNSLDNQLVVGYRACLKDLSILLREADGFTGRGMQPILESLRKKARML